MDKLRQDVLKKLYTVPTSDISKFINNNISSMKYNKETNQLELHMEVLELGWFKQNIKEREGKLDQSGICWKFESRVFYVWMEK